MKFTILMGSPRKDGNTASLLLPFLEELEKNGHETSVFWLYDLNLRGCTACRACQQEWDGFHCSIQDDCQTVFEAVRHTDVMVLATPIYSWFCTAPMKAVLDRLGSTNFTGGKRDRRWARGPRSPSLPPADTGRSGGRIFLKRESGATAGTPAWCTAA